jgi:hypothetical protein
VLQASKSVVRIKKKDEALPTLSVDIKESRMNELGGADLIINLNDDLLNIAVQ